MGGSGRLRGDARDHIAGSAHLRDATAVMRPMHCGTALAVAMAALAAGIVVGAAAGREDLKPALFGEGVFTTGAYDFFVALTPDQKTAYFCRASADFGYWTILETHRKDKGWSAPGMAPFSGRWSDADPHVTPD